MKGSRVLAVAVSGVGSWTVLAVMPLLAWAAPDAGSVLRQIEPEWPPVLPTLAPRNLAWDEPAAALPGEATTHVQSFRFAGNKALPDHRLTAALRGYVNRPLSLSQMKQAAQVVMNLYRKSGWMARAYLPRQEIDNGVVTLQIVEVKFARAKLPTPMTQRVQGQQLLGMVEAAQPVGQPLNVAQIDRALLLMDDLPGVAVSGNYVAAELEDQTILALQVTDDAALTGSLTLDNHGAKSTGAERVLLSASLNSLAGVGDQINATLLKTQSGEVRRSQYVRLAFSLPLTPNGWRWGLHATDMSYHAQTDQTAQGESQTWGVDANYPLLRSLAQNMYASLALDRKQFASQSGASSQLNRHRVWVLNSSLSGNQLDDWGRGGVTSASASLTLGQVSDVTDATEGQFHKWNFSLSRQQSLGDGLSLMASANMQFTAKSLDSSEKFYLGGANSIRAYPGSEASGDKGHSLSLEMHQKLNAAWTLLAFVDQGRVQPAGGSTGVPVSLSGRGLGLKWQSQQGAEMRVILARRNGQNPQPMTLGQDSDGTLKLNRLWLNMSWPF